MVRRALRKPEVMAAFGITSNSTFYQKIAEGFIPHGVKLDPAGRTVIWWEEEIAAIQQAAIERISKKEAA